MTIINSDTGPLDRQEEGTQKTTRKYVVFKYLSMLCILLIFAVWQIFDYTISQQRDISIDQFYLPLTLVCVLGLTGIIMALLMKKSIMKFMLIGINLILALSAIYQLYFMYKVTGNL